MLFNEYLSQTHMIPTARMFTVDGEEVTVRQWIEICHSEREDGDESEPVLNKEDHVEDHANQCPEGPTENDQTTNRANNANAHHNDTIFEENQDHSNSNPEDDLLVYVDSPRNTPLLAAPSPAQAPSPLWIPSRTVSPLGYPRSSLSMASPSQQLEPPTGSGSVNELRRANAGSSRETARVNLTSKSTSPHFQEFVVIEDRVQAGRTSPSPPHLSPASVSSALHRSVPASSDSRSRRPLHQTQAKSNLTAPVMKTPPALSIEKTGNTTTTCVNCITNKKGKENAETNGFGEDPTTAQGRVQEWGRLATASLGMLVKGEAEI
ncbi:hypothetical protein K435DRAFT_961967 [Dendrothele bispora CBS 962.96]|uniref:Uncharacterized protein n=1 Tax=Dendrothele bispora (strain CBS 962.96) TaxID=1314807 RepID=A0A4S8MNP8_DENBC|nr:hypothetical protein K435DRAFT_961967 [Dendrothele bispora CBS 962.96]